MNDVRARFLKSILEQLPAERIVELHFFTPIRQGHIETGVAVIAAEPERPLPVAEDVPAVEAALDLEAALAMEEASGAAGGATAFTAEDAEDAEDTEDDSDAETASAEDDESPYAALPGEAVGEPGGEATEDVVAYAETPAAPRFEVITAVYRWTRKGPERGKWEVDVTTEADAPLPTVGTVVQGVHDRAGEELEPLRLTHAELQALLGEPSWQTTP